MSGAVSVSAWSCSSARWTRPRSSGVALPPISTTGSCRDLAGVSYSLTAAASDAPPELAPLLREASAQTRQGIRELRSLLVEIYPPELHRQGLEAALGDLLAPCMSRGVETRAPG